CKRTARCDGSGGEQEARDVATGSFGPKAGGIETLRDEMRERNTRVHAKHLDIERAQAHGMLETLDRLVGRASPEPQERPEKPCRHEIGLQHQRLVQKIDPHIEIASEVSERMTAACERHGVALPE